MNSDSNENSQVKLLKLQTQEADFILLDNRSAKDKDSENVLGLLKSRKWVLTNVSECDSST